MRRNIFATILFATFLVRHSNAQMSENVHSVHRLIKADLAKVKGNKSHMFNECIGAGRASEGLRADWQQQLAIVQKDIGFRYIRFHGLLCDEMHVYTEDTLGNAIYNWQYVDKLYDFLLSVNIKPIVEFGFMPPALASGTKTVFWWKGNITPPKSYEKWAAMITAMVKHFEERYGKAEVEKWYFEVWNEPNLKEFFSGTMQEYFKLYEVTAKAVKTVSTTYRVGGPATSGSTWIKESLEYFATIPNLVDFISTHAYGTRSVFDEFGKRRTQMREADGIPIPVRKLRNDVDGSAMKGREIHITEWNSSPNPKDPLHDTYQNASYVLNVLKKCETQVNSMSYWTFTDIFEEAEPPTTPFHGGFGLLNLQNIRKPTYHAFVFMNKLGNSILATEDSACYVAKDAGGNVQILVWDYHLLSPDSSYNQTFYKKELPCFKTADLDLQLKNLKNGKYTLSIYRTGYKHNDPFTAYINMGRPYNLSRAQEQEIRTISGGKPESSMEITITNGTFHKKLELMSNDVYFITINKK